MDTELYNKNRCMRRIYVNTELHCKIVLLVMKLLLSPLGGELDPIYSDRFPFNNKKVAYFINYRYFYSNSTSILICR